MQKKVGGAYLQVKQEALGHQRQSGPVSRKQNNTLLLKQTRQHLPGKRAMMSVTAVVQQQSAFVQFPHYFPFVFSYSCSCCKSQNHIYIFFAGLKRNLLCLLQATVVVND